MTQLNMRERAILLAAVDINGMMKVAADEAKKLAYAEEVGELPEM